jgi:hypothetical protein
MQDGPAAAAQRSRVPRRALRAAIDLARIEARQAEIEVGCVEVQQPEAEQFLVPVSPEAELTDAAAHPIGCIVFAWVPGVEDELINWPLLNSLPKTGEEALPQPPQN